MTTDTTPEAIAALLDGVTAGPWAYNSHREVGPLHTEDDQAFGMICDPVCEVNFDADHIGNARFIAAARDLVPTLAAELDAAIRERDEAVGMVDGVSRYERVAQRYRLALDRAEKAETEAAALRGLVEDVTHFRDILRESITKTDGLHEIILTDGSRHTGQVVDFIYDLLNMQIQLLDAALARMKEAKA